MGRKKRAAARWRAPRPGIDGGLAAVGCLRTQLPGAIPSGAQGKGERVRSIQVGDHTILEQISPEARFNAWTISEVHVAVRRAGLDA